MSHPFSDLEPLVSGELGRAQASEVEAHLRECASCAAEIGALRAEDARIRSWAEGGEAPIDALWSGVQARLAAQGGSRGAAAVDSARPALSLVREAAETEAAGAPRPPPPRGARGRAKPRRALIGGLVAAGLSAAAALLLAPKLLVPTPPGDATAQRAPRAAGASEGLAARSGAEGDADDDASAPEQTASAQRALDRAEQDLAQAVSTLEAQVAAREGGHRAAATPFARASRGLFHVRHGADANGRVRMLEGYASYMRSLRRSLADAGGEGP